jgi:hypothetical protein
LLATGGAIMTFWPVAALLAAAADAAPVTAPDVTEADVAVGAAAADAGAEEEPDAEHASRKIAPSGSAARLTRLAFFMNNRRLIFSISETYASLQLNQMECCTQTRVGLLDGRQDARAFPAHDDGDDDDGSLDH